MVPIRMSSLLSLIQRRLFTTSSSSASSSASKLSSSSPLPNSSSSSSLTLEFLIDSCGLPLQSALSVSKELQIHPNKLHNSQSVLQLLKAYHFTDSHIAKLIQMRPQVLHSRVESNLKPKFEFFIINGMVGKLLPDLIATNPAILRINLDSHIKPVFESLNSVLGCNKNVIAVLKCAPWLLSYGSGTAVKQNIDFLRKEGVTFDKVLKLLRRYPTAVKNKHDRVISVVNVIKNLGIKPETTLFMYAFGVMMKMNESRWKEKTEMFKSLGWSEEEVLFVFKKCPVIFAKSEKKIRMVADFFMNTMKLEHNVLITYPYFFGFSIDKRIRPRYAVIKLLQSKKLIGIEKNTACLLMESEKKFLENYVTKYVDEVPDILQIYRGSRKQKKIET